MISINLTSDWLDAGTNQADGCDVLRGIASNRGNLAADTSALPAQVRTIRAISAATFGGKRCCSLISRPAAQ